MKRIGNYLPWFRKGVLLWTTAWMLAVPLFHVHPDADHRHGEAGHFHGGTVHTVLSRDLDCEFASDQKFYGGEDGVQDHASAFTRPPHGWSEHPEFGLSILSDSTDRKSLKPCLTQAFAIASTLVCAPESHLRIERTHATVSASIVFGHDLQSRAPPSLLL